MLLPGAKERTFRHSPEFPGRWFDELQRRNVDPYERTYRVSFCPRSGMKATERRSREYHTADPSVTTSQIGKRARTFLHVAHSITDPCGHSALFQSRAYIRESGSIPRGSRHASLEGGCDSKSSRPSHFFGFKP